MTNQTTPAYNRLLEDAKRIADERGESLDAAHLALVMLTDPNSTLAFMLQRQMSVDIGEAVTRLRWFLDRPKPGAGEHYVADLKGATEIRRNDTLEVVRAWAPDPE